MVLLTSSQVSIALTSGIVLLFTTALFLSGVAIQQRTLRDLRKAIRPDPRPSPKIYLPDRFKRSTTELPDGTVVDIDIDGNRDGDEDSESAEVVVKVQLSVPEDVDRDRVAGQDDKPARDVKGGAIGQESGDRKQQSKIEEPLSRAERRRKIKEEIRDLSQGESPLYYQRRLW